MVPGSEAPDSPKNDSEAKAKRQCTDSQSVAGLAPASQAAASKSEGTLPSGKGKPKSEASTSGTLRELGQRPLYDAPTSSMNQTAMPSAFVELGALSMTAFKNEFLGIVASATPP